MYKQIDNNGLVNLNLYEGYSHTKYSNLSNNNYESTRTSRYKDIVYTDGTVKILEEIEVNDLDNLPNDLTTEEIEKVKQIYHENFYIDEVVVKRIQIENANFYIETELSKVLAMIGKTCGWFWSIENMQVNVKEPTTSKTLKTIKTTIKLINNKKSQSNTRIFKSIIQSHILNSVEYIKSYQNIYQLKDRIKKI
ncbi:MAG: hypothetical protein IKN63_01300 [Bacilli bacterium]|nr:hypothetical protein [Bacilli bacterium]